MIFKSKDLYFIIGDDKTTKVKEEESKVQVQVLEEQLAEVKLAESEDQVAFDEVQMLIDERLIQVAGHLFKYDAIDDRNVMVAQNAFLCVDRMQGDSRHHYMFHVTDAAQKISYTRVEVEVPILNYSFSEVEKILMWIGKAKENASPDDEIPAWSFMVSNDADVPRLKGVLTKVIFETNMKEDIERACERDDERYLESQVLGDQEKPDEEMQSVYKLEDFEFMDFDLTSVNNQSVQSDEEQQEESIRQSDFGLFDESELENSESI